MVVIGPLDIVGDEFRCDFTSVSRAGDVVTWRGACGFPTPFKPATVIARLTGEILRININGETTTPIGVASENCAEEAGEWNLRR